jgi:archaellum component FlaC
MEVKLLSEDTTKDISSKYNTAPTIETVLERIDALSQNLNARIDKLEEQVGIRLDRIESEVKATHSEMFTLRADFKEFKIQFKEPA